MPEGCRLAVNSRGMWSKKQDVPWEAAGVVQDGAPWGDLGTPQLLAAPGLWGVKVTTDLKLFSLLHRGLQDPVGSQEDKDFGALL